MKLPYEWQIGWRYTCIDKQYGTGGGFISFIAMVSMIGIAIGVAALIIVLSVMNGFQKEVRDRMLSVLAHIEILPKHKPIYNWSLTIKEVKQNPEVVGIAPYIDGQALINLGYTMSGVMLRGIDPTLEGQVSDLGKKMYVGCINTLKSNKFNIIIGKMLALSLNIKIGNTITLLVPQGRITPAGILPRQKRFIVTGIFESGHYEYDNNFVMININDAKNLLLLNVFTGIRIRLNSMQRAPQVARSLSHLLSEDLYIRDWTQKNKNWFLAVQIEKRMMFVILTLIIAVAAFNLVASLVMTVTNKYADIAILRTCGARSSSIIQIFLVQGLIIGAIGTLIGVILGSLIALNIPIIVPAFEKIFHIQFLPSSIYFINELPSDLEISDVVHISLIAFTLSALATLYPSWYASRIKPAEVLRYE